MVKKRNIQYVEHISDNIIPTDTIIVSSKNTSIINQINYTNISSQIILIDNHELKNQLVDLGYKLVHENDGIMVLNIKSE